MSVFLKISIRNSLAAAINFERPLYSTGPAKRPQSAIASEDNADRPASKMLSNNGGDSHLPDKKDAALFMSLCQFVWIQGDPLPLIYDVENEIYTKRGIDLPALKHLKAIGLISLEPGGYVKKAFRRHTRLFYHGKATKIQFLQEANNQLDLGHVLLTDRGKILATACRAQRNQEFYEYVIEKWFQQGMIVSSILPKS